MTAGKGNGTNCPYDGVPPREGVQGGKRNHHFPCGYVGRDVEVRGNHCVHYDKKHGQCTAEPSGKEL